MTATDHRSRAAAPKKARQTPPPSGAAGRVRRRLTSRTATVVAIVIAAVWTIPTAGLLISSFRPEKEIKTTGWWTAFTTNPGFTTENYSDVLFSGSRSSAPLLSYFVNSMVVTIPAVVIPVTLATLAAYALVWGNFRGKDWIYIGFFAMQIVPLQMALVPLLSLFSKGVDLGFIHLQFTFEGNGRFFMLWFAHTCFAIPISVFLMHNFMAELPGEIVESARVDGASHVQVFWRIILPLVGPAIASLAIFQFLWVWNDLLVGLIFAGSGGDVAPLTVRLAEMAGSRGNEWQKLTAGAFVSMIVPLAVFLSMQKYFVRGLLAGSTKG